MVCSIMKPKRRKTNAEYKSSPLEMPVDVVQTTSLHDVASMPLDKCTVSNKTKDSVLATEESTASSALKRERSNKRKSAPVRENKSVKLKQSSCRSDFPDIHLSNVSSPGGTSGGSSLPQDNNYGASQSPLLLTEGMGDSPQSFSMSLRHAHLQTFATKERAGATPVSFTLLKTTGSQILKHSPESPDLPRTNMTTESYVSACKNRKLVITPPEEYIRITDSELLLCAEVVKKCALELIGKAYKDIFLCINKSKSEKPNTLGKEYYKVTFDKGALKLNPVNLTFSPTAAEEKTRAALKKSSCSNTGSSKNLLTPKIFSEKFLKVKDGRKTKGQKELLVTPKAAKKCNLSVGESGGSLVDTLPIEPENANAVLHECDSLRASSQNQAGKGTGMKTIVYSPLEEHGIKENIATVETVSQKLVKLRKNNIGQYQRMVQEAVCKQTERERLASPVYSASKHISEEFANSKEGIMDKITSGRNSKVKKGGEASPKESPVGKDLNLQGSPSAENLYQDPAVAELKILSVFSISLEQHELGEAAVIVKSEECTSEETTSPHEETVAILNELSQGAVNVNFEEHTMVETTSPQEEVVVKLVELNETAVNSQECTTLKTNPLQEEIVATSDEFNEATVISQECSSLETTPHEKTVPITTLGYNFRSSTLLRQFVNDIATGDEHTSAVFNSQEQTAGEPKMILLNSISYDQCDSEVAHSVLQQFCLDQASLESPDDQCLVREEKFNSISQSIGLTSSHALGESGTCLVGFPSLLCQICVEQDSNAVPPECTTIPQGQNSVEPEMTGGVSVWLEQCPPVKDNVDSHPVLTRPQKPVLVEPGSSSAYLNSVAVMDFPPEHDGIGSIAKSTGIKEVHKYNADLQVVQWKSQDTRLWFSSLGLGCFLKDFAELDGPSLMEMVYCLNTQQQFLCSSLKEMGYKLPKILQLFSKLRTLPCQIGHEN